MEMIRYNSKVINKTIEVKRITRRSINKRKTINAKTINKEEKRIREEGYENSIENNETIMNDYNLYPRIK